MAITRGIDVSAVQSANLDWRAVARSGISFVYVKCGNGNNSPDPFFLQHVMGAKVAGLTVGAYHVGFPLRPDPAHPGREPEAQARAHYAQSSAFGTAPGDLPPALDLEYPQPGSKEWVMYGCSADQVRTWAIAYMEEAAKLWGVQPVLYDGYPDYINQHGIDASKEARFSKYPLWVVDYPAPWQHQAPGDDGLLVIPKPWTSWTFWQHCGGGMRLPDGSPVDGDVFNGDLDTLRAFATGRVA